MDDGEEEGQRFACAGSGLGDDIAAVEAVVEGHFLDFGHGVDVHFLGDGVDDSGRHNAMLGQLFKLGKLGRLVVAIFHATGREMRLGRGLLQTGVYRGEGSGGWFYTLL